MSPFHYVNDSIQDSMTGPHSPIYSLSSSLTVPPYVLHLFTSLLCHGCPKPPDIASATLSTFSLSFIFYSLSFSMTITSVLCPTRERYSFESTYFTESCISVEL
eukprot:940756_1